MLGYFVLGVVLLLVLLLLARGAAAADPRALARGVRIGGGVAAAGLAVYLLVSGRWPIAIMAASAALPLIGRGSLMRWIRGGSGAQPMPGKHSEVTTRLLRMTLDHDTGGITGEVIGGVKAGRGLDSLELVELLDLLTECRTEDGQSVPLLEAYLERRFGPDWRIEAERRAGHGESAAPPMSGAAMSRREAYEILGLEEGADHDQIKEAYRRLIVKLHPDAGGSAFLAAKLNAAKDMLIGE